MSTETITVKITETGRPLEVTVQSKRADLIRVVVGQGIHNVPCDLKPTANGLAYAGEVRGREIVYEKSRAAVQADIDRADPRLRKSRRF